MSAKITILLASILTFSDRVSAQPYAYVSNYGSALPNSTISVIDADADEVITDVAVGPYPEGLVVSPDGRTVFVANAGSTTVSVIDAATNSLRATIDGFVGPEGLALSRDGQRLYVTNSTYQFQISVVDTSSYRILRTIDQGRIGRFVPSALAVSADGRWLVGTTRDSDDEMYPCQTVCMLPVFVIDTTTDSPVHSSYLDDAISIAVSADGSRVFVPGQHGLYGLDSSLIDLWTIQPGWGFVALRPSSDLLYQTRRREVAVIDTIKGSIANVIIASPNTSSFLEGLAFTPDGGKLYVADAPLNRVLVIDPSSNAVSKSIPVGISPSQIAVGPVNPVFSPSASPSPTPLCVGDCDHDGTVTIDDVIRAVGVALGENPFASCSAGDANGDGIITIDEIMRAIVNLLGECAQRAQG